MEIKVMLTVFVCNMVAISTLCSVMGSVIDILVDQSLPVDESRELASFVEQINTSLASSQVYNNRSGESSVKLHTVYSWDTFHVAQTVKSLNDGNAAAAILWCHQCNYVTAMSQSGICSVMCLESTERRWSTCHEYLLALSKFSEILIKTLNRSDSLVVFYDNDRELSMEPIIEELSVHTRGMYKVLGTEPGCTDSTYRIPLANETLRKLNNFIISVAVNTAASFLHQGSIINILGPEYNWLVDIRSNNSLLDEVILSDYMQEGDNTALVSRIHLSHSEHARQLVHSCTYNTNSTVPQADILDIKKCISSCDPPDTLTTVAKVNNRGHINNISYIFPNEFEGFHGRYFNIVTLEYDPFIIIREDENGTSYYTGLCIELLNVLAEQLNFRYRIRDVADGKFGILENGTWNGMIGDVLRKEADIAVSGLTISHERETVVDFTFPFWEEPTAVLVKRTQSDPKLFWIFRPLHWQVWLILMATIVVVALLITGFTRISACENPVPRDDPFYHLHNTLWYVFGASIQQGGHEQPKTFPGQAMTGSWWSVVIIVYGIYTGNLIAFLAITNIPLPFETLEEMTSQTVYKYGVEDGIIQMMLFQTAEDGLYKDIWDGIKSDPDNLVESGAEGVEKVMKEKYAFIGDKTYIETAASGKCDLVFIKQEFYKVGFGFAVQQGWPYKKYFDDAIMKLVEGGFIERWRHEYWPTDNCDVREQVVGSQPITMVNLSGNFAVLFFGIVASALLFSIEHLHKRFAQRVCDSCLSQCCAKWNVWTTNQQPDINTHCDVTEISRPMGGIHRTESDAEETQLSYATSQTGFSSTDSSVKCKGTESSFTYSTPEFFRRQSVFQCSSDTKKQKSKRKSKRLSKGALDLPVFHQESFKQKTGHAYSFPTSRKHAGVESKRSSLQKQLAEQSGNDVIGDCGESIDSLEQSESSDVPISIQSSYKRTLERNNSTVTVLELL